MNECCGQPSFCEKPCFHGGKGSVLDVQIGGDDIEEGHCIVKLCEWLATDEGKSHKVELPLKQCNVTQVVLCGFLM